MNTLLLGKWGEALAAEYLRKKKYVILDAGFHTRYGELDLVAENKTHLVFVEVKLRKNTDHGFAAEAVTKSKQRKIIGTAKFWARNKKIKKYIRFDVIEVYAPDGISDNYTINHIEGAFVDESSN